MGANGWGWNIGVVSNVDETDWSIVDFREDAADAFARALEIRAEVGDFRSVYILDPLRRSAEGVCYRAWCERQGVAPGGPGPSLN